MHTRVAVSVAVETLHRLRVFILLFIIFLLLLFYCGVTACGRVYAFFVVDMRVRGALCVVLLVACML